MIWNIDKVRKLKKVRGFSKKVKSNMYYHGNVYGYELIFGYNRVFLITNDDIILIYFMFGGLYIDSRCPKRISSLLVRNFDNYIYDIERVIRGKLKFKTTEEKNKILCQVQELI
jgi:hypothetical protein